MYITLLMAQTLDGKIARNPGQNADWTSREDKKYFVQLTKEVGTIIMGMGTFRAMGCFVLPGRRNVILGDKPYPKSPVEGQLQYLSGTPQDIVKALESQGVTRAILGGGAYTNNQFLKAGLVNEVHITIASRLFGEGLGFCDGEPLDIPLERTEVRELSVDTLLLTFKCLPHAG